MFVDSAQIHVKAGDGGSGCVAFRREKYIPKGGPSGGNGGHGGKVIVVADQHLRTLLDFRYKRKYVAQRGEHGKGDNKTGKNGRDIIIRLPVGTLIKDATTLQPIIDLIADGQGFVIAQGGKGGYGNAHFASPTNQAPREWTTGASGEERNLDLELKLLADVGLVGLPNAGKSTLLSRISAARPKIADYPFTTLSPNLGIVKVADGKSFTVADIPGLIEGAHVGKGLGTKFLRHIDRTKLLLLLLDSNSAEIEKDYQILINELESYDKKLLHRPRVIIYTKCDISNSVFIPLDDKMIGTTKSMVISAVRGDNLDHLVNLCWSMLMEK
jgi:GTPase